MDNKQRAIEELKEVLKEKGIKLLVKDITEIATKYGIDESILDKELEKMINGKRFCELTMKEKLDKAIDIRNKYMEDMKENGVDLGDSNREMIFCTLSSNELHKTAEYLGVTLIGTEYYDPDDDYEYQEFFIYRGVKFFHLKERGVE